MAFCENCGYTLKPNAKFCGSCGTPTELIEDTPKGTSSKSRSKAKPKQDNYEDWSRDWNRRKKERKAAESWKSETTTLLCSIFGGLIGLQGIGYLYLGKIGKGIGYLIGSLALFIAGIVLLILLPYTPAPGILCFVVYVVMFIWQILDSWRLCKKHNDYYEEFGTRPKW